MRALPAPVRAAWLALAASLIGHMALLGDGPQRRDVARPPRAIQATRLQPPAPPMPEATPEATPVTTLPPVAPAVRPAMSQPAAPPADQPEPAPATPPLRLAGPATWPYQLRQDGQDGVALLAWEPQADGRYRLRLTRQLGGRELPAQESLGRTGMAGLTPERFALQRDGQDRQAINFDTAARLISFSASTARLPAPDGVQDRLSWWLQLAALVQASPAPGGRWRVWVAGLRGELREWVFEAVEPGADDAGWLHLRRQRLGEQDPGVELWLDPARGYWPVRLRQGDPETRGYEIVLGPVNF
ncbi:hypothetical protein [Roseateles sp. BYS96W]|uniref:DUF3108 domain-containing protein n=1 Tax=Pelomonas nitida TaxID=3299027 RepID=A0ABW7G884_9BURK